MWKVKWSHSLQNTISTGTSENAVCSLANSLKGGVQRFKKGKSGVFCFCWWHICWTPSQKNCISKKHKKKTFWSPFPLSSKHLKGRLGSCVGWSRFPLGIPTRWSGTRVGSEEDSTFTFLETLYHKIFCFHRSWLLHIGAYIHKPNMGATKWKYIFGCRYLASKRGMLCRCNLSQCSPDMVTHTNPR